MWLVKSSWCVQCCSIHQFYWVSDRCRSGFALWWFFFSEKSCRYKLVVFTSFWSWLVNVSSILTSLKYTATFFGVVNALWVCWQFMGALSFNFHLCFSEICHFLCLSLMRSFVVHFFSFFRIFCGYLSHLDVFIVVPFISSSGLAIVAEANLRCGDFCQTFVVFINWKLELIMFFHLLMLPGSAFFRYQFFFCGIMSLYVSISDAVFFVTSFSIFDQCLADTIVLMCSFWFIYSILLG